MIDVDNYNVKLIDSRIHELNCVYKVLSIFFMLLFLLLSNSSMDIFMINLFLFVLMVWSNIKFRVFLKIISIFSVFLFLIFFLLSLIYFDLFISLVWIIKLIDFIIYLALIGLTTSYFDLVLGVGFIFKSIYNNAIVYNISGFIKFISIMYSEKIRVETSKRLRGVQYSSISFVDKIDVLLNDFFMVIKFSLHKLSRLRSNVIISKGEVNFLKYKYVLNKWSKTDTILLIINFLMMFIVLVY